VVCCGVVENPFKAKNIIRHLKTKHDCLAESGTEFFKRKAGIIKTARRDSSGS
jgi:hypothetical protein